MPSGRQPARARRPADDAARAENGFDVTPAGKSRPAGLSAGQKSLIALGVLAILGAVAFVADLMAAQRGYTPAGGFERVDGDDGDSAGLRDAPAAASDDGAPPGSAAAPDQEAGAPSPTGLPLGLGTSSASASSTAPGP